MFDSAKPKLQKSKHYCTCKSARPCLMFCRTFGLFPVSWTHENNKCTYSVSKFWILYSLVISGLFAYRLSELFYIIITPFNSDRSLLLGYISNVVEGLVSLATVLLIFLNIFRAPKFVEVMNSLTELTLNDLLCQHSLHMYYSLNKHYFITLLFTYGVDYIVILAINYLDSYDTSWEYERLLLPLIQTTFTHLHYLFSAMCVLCLTILNCYSNKMKNSLQLTTIHPISEYRDRETGTRIFMKVYQFCTSKHVKHMHKTELIAYLQELYKQILKNLDTMNDAFNPQIVLHMSCELLVIVFHFYAVIIYLTFDDVSPSDKTNNIFNWFFIIIRLSSMYTFLNTAQQVENLVSKMFENYFRYGTACVVSVLLA